MAVCHGQGDPRADPFTGGCCYVNGAVCPNRWFIDWAGAIGPPETVYNSDRQPIGLLDDVIRSLVGNAGPRRDRARRQAMNIRFVCTAAISVIANDPSLLTNRAAFDAAWAAESSYQPIADAWQAAGKPRNWCQLFGPTEGHCCFREDAVTNATRAASLDPEAVQVRVAATGAS